MPGACFMISTASPASPLVISLSAPPRMMMARSGAPAVCIVREKPSAIDRTATKTITTPAMPTTATADEPRRSRMVRMLSQATEKIWVKNDMALCLLSLPQRVGDLQPHGAGRRQDAGRDAGHHHQHHAQHEVARGEVERRQPAAGRIALEDEQPGQ